MAAGTIPIAPLTNSQKLFLQRLLVQHVLTDSAAKELYASIKTGFANVAPPESEDEEEDSETGAPAAIDHGYMGDDLNHVLGIINASLVPAFNLEVCTVALPPPYDPDDGASPPPQSPGGRRKRPAALVRYHAIVNRSNDGVAKSHAFPASRGGPHEMAYFRMALERIAERGAESLREDAGGGGAVGCPGAISRMELINLRTDLEGDHRDKLSIAQVESALGLLEGEGWLVRAAPPGDDDDDDESEEEGARPKRKRRGARKSLRGTFYGIGPRSFMELGDFLQKAGFPGDRMPQSILHRV